MKIYAFSVKSNLTWKDILFPVNQDFDFLFDLVLSRGKRKANQLLRPGTLKEILKRFYIHIFKETFPVIKSCRAQLLLTRDLKEKKSYWKVKTSIVVIPSVPYHLINNVY